MVAPKNQGINLGLIVDIGRRGGIRIFTWEGAGLLPAEEKLNIS